MSASLSRRLSMILSLLGVFVALCSFLYYLSDRFQVPSESLSALVGVVASVVAGAASASIASAARHLRKSKRVFLSHSREDAHTAASLAEALRDRGVKVWLDYEQLRAGDPVGPAVARALAEASALVALFSRPPGPNVIRELEVARQQGIRIIPVVASNVELPASVSDLFQVDLRQNTKDAIDRLLSAIEA